MPKFVDISGYRSPVADAIGALAQAMYADQATGARNRAAAQRAQMETAGTRTLADLFAARGGGAPVSYNGAAIDVNDPRQFQAHAGAQAILGGFDPQDLAELERGFAANVFGAEDARTTNAFVGAGGSFGNTATGFSRDQARMERDSLRDDATARYGINVRSADSRYGVDQGILQQQREFENALVEVMRDGRPLLVPRFEVLSGSDAPLMSETQRKAQMAGAVDLTRDETLAYLGAEPSAPPVAKTFYDTATGRNIRTTDGIHDALTGEVMPATAMQVSVQGAPQDYQLDKINDRNVEAGLLALEEFDGLIENTRQLVLANPQAVGAIGGLREGVQTAQQLADQFDALVASGDEAANRVAGQVDALVASLEDSPFEVVRDAARNYDPSRGVLQSYATLLPYAAASALAQQTGRGLSDQDVKRFTQLLGDPTSMLMYPQKFLARVETVQNEVRRLYDVRTRVREQGVAPELPPVQAAPQPERRQAPPERVAAPPPIPDAGGPPPAFFDHANARQLAEAKGWTIEQLWQSMDDQTRALWLAD